MSTTIAAITDPLPGAREYETGGGWGNSIEWTAPEQFKADLSCDTLYGVVGWKPRIPHVGDILKAKFQKSTIWFVFVSVDPQRDPSDMFFAKVRIYKQEMK